MKTSIISLFLGAISFFSFSQERFVYKDDIPFSGDLEIIWKTKAGKEFGYAPHIDGNVLFVVNAIERPDTGRGQILAFNKDDGSLKWSSSKHYGEPIQDLVIDGDQIIYTTRRGVYGVSKIDGSDLWEFSNPFVMQIGSSPAVFGDIVVAATSDYEVFGFSRSKLELVWERKLTEIATPTLYKHESNVIFSDFEEGIYSLDSRTGKTNWYLKRPVASELLVDGDLGYIGNGERGLLCLELVSGDIKWEAAVDDGNPYINGQVKRERHDR